MRKIFLAGISLFMLFGLASCGNNVVVEQNTTSLEVGMKGIVWKDFITLENPDKYKITCDASNVDINVLGDYTVTYSIQNKDNNKVIKQDFIFTVEDTIAPKITVKEDIEVVLNTDFDPMEFIKIKDNYDKLTEENVEIQNTVDTTTLGEYTVTYTVKDASGNETIKTIPVTVIEEMTPKRMEEKLAEQPVFITSTKYVVQDTRYKALYPDMLQVIIKNNGEDKIRDAVIAFAAWDKNGLPLRIKGQYDFSTGPYIKQVAYDDINLVPGSTFGNGYGFSIDEDNNINNFRAIVVSYTTFDDETWENPVYSNWCELFEGTEYVW